MELSIAQQYKMSSSSLGKGVDGWTLVDGLADNPEAAFLLISS